MLSNLVAYVIKPKLLQLLIGAVVCLHDKVTVMKKSSTLTKLLKTELRMSDFRHFHLASPHVGYCPVARKGYGSNR